jgi:hypothetical protein
MGYLACTRSVGKREEPSAKSYWSYADARLAGQETVEMVFGRA